MCRTFKLFLTKSGTNSAFYRETIMQYTLMHKNTPVLEMVLDDASCTISQVTEIYHAAHVPIGISMRNGVLDRSALNAWWRGRSIPASRQGIRQALETLRIGYTQQLLEKSYGLSLSDQYWIRAKHSDLQWDDINFFQNSFSDDIGDILFGKKLSDDEGISLMSPDNTSDGWLKKKWTIIDGKRCLIKGGSGAIQQEPYNEVIASCLMDRLQVSHVAYRLILQNDYPYSVCEDFITPDTELVPAWYIVQTLKKENHHSNYQHYLRCCTELGIPEIQHALDQMLVVDFLLANEDRHFNNFGVIRNAETLKWVGAAPIYDTGTSLWFSTPTKLIHPTAANLPSKPFRDTHIEQIKLVSSFDWINFNALRDFGDEVRALLSDSLFVDHERGDKLADAIEKRIELLCTIALQK